MNHKTPVFLFWVISLVVLACGGCNREREVSGPEFVAMLQRDQESMRATQFIGIRNGMAVLKVSEMSLVNQRKWTDSYYVTPATNLPPDFPFPKPAAVR